MGVGVGGCGCADVCVRVSARMCVQCLLHC